MAVGANDGEMLEQRLRLIEADDALPHQPPS
jgi:hypothetical protein